MACGYKAFRSFLATTNQLETHDLNIFETHVIPQDDDNVLILPTDQDDVSRQPSDPVQMASDDTSINNGAWTRAPRQQMPPYNSHQSCKLSRMMSS